MTCQHIRRRWVALTSSVNMTGTGVNIVTVHIFLNTRLNMRKISLNEIKAQAEKVFGTTALVREPTPSTGGSIQTHGSRLSQVYGLYGIRRFLKNETSQ